MSPFLRSIYLSGVSPNLSLDERSRIIVMNSVSFSTIVILLMATIVIMTLGSYAILQSLLSFPLLMSVILLNRKGRFRLSRILFTYGVLILVFALALLNRKTGTEFFLMTIACSSAFAFKDTRSVILAFSISTLLYGIYAGIDHSLPFEGDGTTNYALLSAIMAILAGGIVFIEMIVFRNLIHRFSNSLDYANKQLYQANEELNSINESLDAVVKERTDEVELRGERLKELVDELNSKNEKLNHTIETLRQRNYEMDQLVYQLSHRLKAPLCSIAGLNNLMKIDPTPELIQTALPKVDKKIQEMDNVFKSVSSMTNFNNQLPEWEEVNVSELLFDVIQKLNKIRGGSLVTVLLEPFECSLITDIKMLRVVFHQVIKNAIMFRHTKRKGLLEIKGRQQGDSFIIDFKDNGIGITPGAKEKVFEMFSKISDQSSGAGLGLYITREVLKKLGGSVGLDSDETGTRVTLILPCLQTAPDFVTVAKR